MFPVTFKFSDCHFASLMLSLLPDKLKKSILTMFNIWYFASHQIWQVYKFWPQMTCCFLTAASIKSFAVFQIWPLIKRDSSHSPDRATSSRNNPEILPPFPFIYKLIHLLMFWLSVAMRVVAFPKYFHILGITFPLRTQRPGHRVVHVQTKQSKHLKVS